MAASTQRRGRGSGSKESRANKHQHRPPLDVEEPYVDEPWTPTAYTTFKLLLSARLCAAIWSNISDCDEVFNYWEPVHYLLHGSGFQTWEYSPAYAIRSYAYIWLHVFPLKIYATFLQAHKILQFYFLRCLLGFICALCEVYFYKGICKRFGPNVGRLTLVFLVFSPGIFISCSALLPSSFTMYGAMITTGAWFLGHFPIAIFSVAASAIVGWPFAGAIGVPIAYDMLFRKPRVFTFIKWSFFSGALCLVPLVQIDSHYYGGLVIAPLNIVLYNVLSDHGPDLYGVAPWYFYILNGLLNFNIAFIMSFVVFPFVLLVRKIIGLGDRGHMPMWLTLAPLFIWFAIFFTQPHKEERFLFPVYPLICMTAALTLDHVQRLYGFMFNTKESQRDIRSSNWIALTCSVVFAVFSLSRTIALYQGYHAPLDVYVELTRLSAENEAILSAPDKPINVCVGKEWYRFPSSFFLPDDRWHLQFLKSEFRGQLPKQFEKGVHATRKEPSHMNDMNREETSRYIDISVCDFLIDLDLPQETAYEPRYSTHNDTWNIVSSTKFLDASRSQQLLRAFYIPFASEMYCSYVDYNLYERIMPSSPKTKKKKATTI